MSTTGCASCGRVLERGRGRPARFCCGACRYRWHGRRATLREQVARLDRPADSPRGQVRALYARRADAARSELGASER